MIVQKPIGSPIYFTLNGPIRYVYQLGYEVNITDYPKINNQRKCL